jgi:SAM-dependent methyltransferase
MPVRRVKARTYNTGDHARAWCSPVTTSRGRVARAVRPWLETTRDAADLVRRLVVGGRRQARLPPRSLRDVGPGDFEAIGREFLGYFVRLGGLQPGEHVLEIGCGSGRMALPLADYLAPEGRYVGLEIVARAVRWCQRRITRRHPNFTFLHVDVFNQRYNPSGTIRARDHVFPLADRSFDFVFLTSVFTHMYPDDTRHYLREIARLLRPTGRLFSTWFLLNPAQAALAGEGRNLIDFRFAGSGYRTRDASVPESAVAVEETLVRAMHAEAGLAIREPIRFGGWTGRGDGLSLQDIVLADPIPAGPPR